MDYRKYAPFLLGGEKYNSKYFKSVNFSESIMHDVFGLESTEDESSDFSLHSQDGLDEYLVIPSWNNPRWFIPNCKSIISNVGNIIKPSSFKAIVAWKIALFLNIFGLTSLMFSDKIFIKKKQKYKFLDSNTDKVKHVIYTGSPGVFQKFTVQEMNSTMDVTAFYKFGISDDACTRIQAEAKALEFLSKFFFSEFDHPVLISSSLSTCISSIKQTSCSAKFCKILFNFNAVHKKFIHEKYNKTKQDISPSKIGLMFRSDFDSLNWENTKVSKYKEGCLTFMKSLLIDVNSKGTLSTSFSHGDFTPWNAFSDGNKLYVFDWEMAKQRVILWDYFNFVYHSNILRKDNFKERISYSLQNDKKWILDQYLISSDLYNIYHRCYLLDIFIHYLSQSICIEDAGYENVEYLVNSFFIYIKEHK